MYFDEKLKKLRLDKGLSLEELSRELNIPESMLEGLETGFRDPSAQDLTKITEFFKVSPEDIADDQPAVNAFSVLFGTGGVLPSALPTQPFADGQALLPDAPPISFLNEAIKRGGQETIYEYPDKYIRAAKAPAGEYILLRVPDDSMRAFGILKGDAAIVRRQNVAAPGDIAAVWNKAPGGVSLRLVRKDGREAADGSCPLPALAQDDQIYGRVVEIRRNF
ncbi:MAG: helix-turn-helix domain-containing protein [Acidaminococcales bacterium]|jgi:transcriptional regulator with XRE-family HTH domain|nr:helix-turn-helix domain-containing protein [Acidaminococcales bacterium]